MAVGQSRSSPGDKIAPAGARHYIGPDNSKLAPAGVEFRPAEFGFTPAGHKIRPDDSKLEIRPDNSKLTPTEFGLAEIRPAGAEIGPAGARHEIGPAGARHRIGPAGARHEIGPASANIISAGAKIRPAGAEIGPASAKCGAGRLRARRRNSLHVAGNFAHAKARTTSCGTSPTTLSLCRPSRVCYAAVRTIG